MSGGRSCAHVHDVVELAALDVRCVVGVYGHERTRVQPLTLHLAMHLDLRPAGDSDEVAHTIDYGRVAGEVRFLLEHARFRLIESAAETIARYLLLPPTADALRPQVQRAVVRVDKPEALRGLARPAVVVTREVAEVAPRVTAAAFGSIEVLHQSRYVTVSRVRVRPGANIDAHRHHDADEAELTLDDGLEAQGRALPWSTGVVWARGQVHQWENRSAAERTLLRVARPFAADEPVAVAAAELVLPATIDYAPAGTRA